MIRALLIATLFVLTLAGMLAAPIPKGTENPVLYYPTTVGTKWTYELDGEEFTAKITTVGPKYTLGQDGDKLKFIKDKGCVAVRTEGGLDEAVGVSEKGLCYLSVCGGGQEPGLCWLRIPARVGDTWETRILPKYPASSLVKAEAGTMTVCSIDFIIVPAGKFEAIHLEGRCEQNGQQLKEQRWYAPRVGLVKCVNCSGQELVLKSISVAE